MLQPESPAKTQAIAFGQKEVTQLFAKTLAVFTLPYCRRTQFQVKTFRSHRNCVSVARQNYPQPKGRLSLISVLSQCPLQHGLVDIAAGKNKSDSPAGKVKFAGKGSGESNGAAGLHDKFELPEGEGDSA